MKLNSKQKNLLVAALAILTLAVFSWFGSRKIAPAPRQDNNSNPIASKTAQAIVTKVLDGDTIIIQGGFHVRLLGIDADEPDYLCYQAAKTQLEELILGKTVVLESDAQDKDQYGRLLRYIFLDGKNINEQMVAEGLAIARFYPENQKYKDQIIAAESAAMNNKIGCKWQQ